MTRFPAEPLLGLDGEDLVGREWRRRERRRCALLEPLEDVTAADHDHDHGETTVSREHALQNQVELSRRDAGATDVSHVYPLGTEQAEMVRGVEYPLERSRPARLLSEREALD